MASPDLLTSYLRYYRLLLAYKGTHYLGWQKTRMGASIEEELEKALYQILQHPIALQAASRTDAGVHALGQVVNFGTDKEQNPHRLRGSLNRLLSTDIRILEATEIPRTFHPSLDCIGKEYRYTVCIGTVQLPQQREFSWHFPYPLHLKKMEQGAHQLIGKRDFQAFCNTKKNSKNINPICDLKEILIHSQNQSQLSIRMVGNRFLYKMARTIAGTLLDIGRGRLDLSQLPRLLAEGDRTETGVTAPAHGLTLHHLYYPEDGRPFKGSLNNGKDTRQQ